ncbi:MAG: hypothetical protein IPM26_08620 [Saprospiraceae bacterium]|nr:hypothetical protein [Saprospiraceae bacterium]
MKHFIKFYTLYYIIIVNVHTSVLIAQQKFDYGYPEIISYTRNQYSGGTQNWSITSGKFNTLLVANNDGLLIFDGHRWEKYYLPNRTIVRSVAYDRSKDRIYAGGQDEFGYFSPDKSGKLVFKDLVHSIPQPYRSLEDVWDINLRNNLLYFRSMNRLYIHDGTNWKVAEFGDRVLSLSALDEALVCFVQGEGLHSVENLQSTFIQGSEVLENVSVVSVVQTGKSEWVIFTEKDGVYLYTDGLFIPAPNEISSYLKQNLVHSAKKISDRYIAVGTYLSGLVITDHKLQVRYILNKNNGLLNNTVSSLYADVHGQLWAGTYNGINCVKLQSPYSLFSPDGSLAGAVYDVEIFDNKLYCGTENGLYYRPLPGEAGSRAQSDFKLVKGSEGQVWGLDVVAGDLIMSHNDGAFLVRDDKVLKIGKNKGAWKFIEWTTPATAVGGYYDGLYFFEKSGGQWIQKEKIENFNESSRIFVRFGNDIWLTHPYRGLFRISISNPRSTAGIKSYGPENGLPTNYRNHVFLMHDQIMVAAEKDIYLFDQDSDRFVRMDIFDEHFPPGTEFKRLFSDPDHIWYITSDETGCLSIQDNLLDKNAVRKEIYGITGRLVAGFENIFPLGNGQAMILTNNGVIYFHPEKEKNYAFTPYITTIRFSRNDSVIHFRNIDCLSDISNLKCNLGSFDYKSNAIELTFASGSLETPVYYRYKLNGMDEEWSEWTSRNFKEFSNIPHGKYRFLLQAKNGNGNESEPVEYSFQILPPWYRTGWAYFLYLLMISGFLYGGRRRLVKKFESKTIQLEEAKKESDARVEQLINEKLEAEIMFKNKELGLSTMHLMQKNETLTRLKQELGRIKNMSPEPSIRQEIKSLMSILSEDERLDDEWETFAHNFDQVHNNFLQRIKQKHPALTPKELKLCAYLRMNLTTKELAPLLNISVRGVEISRYRLRKKLGIPGDANLNDYMMSI